MRQKRKLLKGATYHVTARVNNSVFYFEDNRYKQLLTNIVEKAHEKYHFEMHAYSIMDNHAHFLIKPTGQDEEELSRIMQWILSDFARIYNDINQTAGHVWYDRFKSKIIQDDDHWNTVFKYIVENPVRAKKIKNPVNYQFNSLAKIRDKMESGEEYPMFDELPKYLKSKILSILEYFEDLGSKTPESLTSDNSNTETRWDHRLSFHSAHSKWCRFSDKRKNDKKKYKRKYKSMLKARIENNLKKALAG